ncbi:MAG: cbb3-type cytochrome c oxidase N-terminal domain-containing protein [Ginsengibacter sp.]
MNKYLKTLLIVSAFLPFHSGAFAQNKELVTHSASEPLAIVMISIAVLFIAVIGLLGKIVLASYEIHKEREKKKRFLKTSTITAIMLLFASATFAQDAVAVEAVVSGLIGGLSKTAFYSLLSVIILELIIIAFLARTFFLFTRLEKAMKPLSPKELAEKKNQKWAWFEKLNKTRSLDAASEAEVNLGHDYDGIGELDNPTPPWWQWGFVLSVIFSFVYMYVYHISESAPLQVEELAIANEKAEKQIASYLANTASLVDENNVTYLGDASDLAAGQTIFVAACAACHGVDGGGIVGPNLTDEYWLNGGSMKDIFRTIKYGVPEKGMKSWKDDYSPKQIAQISSYIHSLQGTKPLDPKPAEGEKYTEAEVE